MLKVHAVCQIYVGFAMLSLVSVAQPGSAQVRYSVVELGVLEQASSSIVRGFNSANEVCGGNIGVGRGTRAFLLTNGGAENLEGLPGTDASVAHAMNDDTTVVGSANTARAMRAFLWTRREGVQDLGTLPGDSGSEAFGINSQQEVVGYSSGPTGIEAVLWTRDGSMQRLGRLRDGDYSRAFAINAPGDIVGTSGNPLGTRATLWARTGAIQDLNTLIPADSDFVLTQAVNINSPGTILAIGHDAIKQGHDHELPTRVFLLFPRP